MGPFLLQQACGGDVGKGPNALLEVLDLMVQTGYSIYFSTPPSFLASSSITISGRKNTEIVWS